MIAVAGFNLRGPWGGWGRLIVALLTGSVLWSGCAPASRLDPPAAATADTAAAPSDSLRVVADSAVASDSADAVPVDPTIPPGYLPPPGQCRVWSPGEPVDEQSRAHPVGRCSELRRSLPEDAWLIYRPPDDSGFVRVWRYAEDGGVVSQRIHDVETGKLLRHVAPAGS